MLPSELCNRDMKIVRRTTAKITEVIMVCYEIGDGSPEHPINSIEEYYTKSGKYIATTTASAFDDQLSFPDEQKPPISNL